MFSKEKVVLGTKTHCIFFAPGHSRRAFFPQDCQIQPAHPTHRPPSFGLSAVEALPKVLDLIGHEEVNEKEIGRQCKGARIRGEIHFESVS
jgi:hypothetical protein